MSIQKSVVFRDAPANTFSSAAATINNEIKFAPYTRGVGRAFGSATSTSPLNNPHRTDLRRRSKQQPRPLLLGVPRRVSTQLELLPSFEVAARIAAATPGWVGTLNALEVLDVGDASDVGADQRIFPLSHKHSRSTLSVVTDTDIADECRSTDSASSAETASPLHGYQRMRKHLSRFKAGQHSESDASVGTELALHEETGGEDFLGSTIVLDHCGTTMTQTNSEMCPLVASHRIAPQPLLSNESSVNFDKVDEEESRTSSCHRPVLWLNRHESCVALEKDVAEEII